MQVNHLKIRSVHFASIYIIYLVVTDNGARSAQDTDNTNTHLSKLCSSLTSVVFQQ